MNFKAFYPLAAATLSFTRFRPVSFQCQPTNNVDTAEKKKVNENLSVKQCLLNQNLRIVGYYYLLVLKLEYKKFDFAWKFRR